MPRLAAATATAAAAAATTAAIAARPKQYASALPADTLQLGFLLPWAARASFSTASPSSSSSSRPTSDLDSDSTSSARPRQSNASPSFIHRNLARPNPPLPLDLLNHLKARPQLLTRSGGEALAAYARRMGNKKVERALETLMMRKRMGPLPLAFASRQTKWKGKGKAHEDDDQVDAYFSSSLSSPSSETRRYPFRPNKWALGHFPPIEALPSHRYTAKELLEHIHWLLLHGQAPELDSTLILLRTAIDWPDRHDWHGAAQTRCPSGDAPAQSTAGDRERWAELGMLHLYLAYAGRRARRRSFSSSTLDHDTQPQSSSSALRSQNTLQNSPSASDLLQKYLDHHPHPAQRQRPNRQTLHLLILSTLSREKFQSHSQRRDSKLTTSTAQLPQARAPPPPAAPASPRNRNDDNTHEYDIIRVIKDFHSVHGLTPAPETWRHVALHALNVADEYLAKEAWKGWMRAMRRAEAQADNSHDHDHEVEAEADRVVARRSIARPLPGKADIVASSRRRMEEERDSKEIVNGIEIGIGIRFRNLGTMRKRWWGVMKAMEEKGWVERERPLERAVGQKGMWCYDHIWIGGGKQSQATARDSSRSKEEVQMGSEGKTKTSTDTATIQPEQPAQPTETPSFTRTDTDRGGTAVPPLTLASQLERPGSGPAPTPRRPRPVSPFLTPLPDSHHNIRPSTSPTCHRRPFVLPPRLQIQVPPVPAPAPGLHRHVTPTPGQLELMQDFERFDEDEHENEYAHAHEHKEAELARATGR